MYLIYNNDGSIRFAITNDYIQQGSNNVNYIDIAIDNYSTSNYTCDCLFTLPNSTTITLAGVVQNFSYSGENYSGYRIWLSSAVLAYAGILRFNIRLYNSTGAILYTYQYEQNVNATSLSTDWEAPITQAQYNSFMALLTTYINAYDPHLIRKYASYDLALADISNLSLSQHFLVDNGTSYEIYYKSNDTTLTLLSVPTNWADIYAYIGLTQTELTNLGFNNLVEYINSNDIQSISFSILTGVLTATITLKSGLTKTDTVDLGNTFNTKQVQLAIDGAQDANINAAQSTANTAVANAQTAQNTADEALALANTKNKSYSFATFNDMKSALASAVSTIYHIGDNLYIEATDSPDYWVSKVNAVSSGDYGYYEIKELEVDTSTFAKQSSLETTNQNVTTNTNEISSIKTNYATNLALATTNQNVSNNASAISSIQANYATNLALQAVEDEIPTNVGELTNNVGYITATNYAGESVGGVILASSLSGSETNLVEVKINATTHKLYAPSIPTLDIEIVASLPATGSTGVIYLVPATTTTTTNLYKEYVWVNSKWEELGNLDIQLSNYATITWVQSQLNTKQNVINITDNTLGTTYPFSNIVILTQNSYDNLATKNNSTKYIIKDSIASYLGTIQESGTPILSSPIYYTSKASLLADYPTTTSEINETIGLNYNVGSNVDNSPFNLYTNLTYIKGIVLGDNFTSAYAMFGSCGKLTSIPYFDTKNVTNMNSMFGNCSFTTDIPLFNTSNVSSMGYMFYFCSSLTNVPALDASKVNNLYNAFYKCVKLTSILMYGMKVSFDISASTLFTESALVTILNNLATVGTTQTLTMGATNLAKLTDTEKAIATNKNWTLA